MWQYIKHYLHYAIIAALFMIGEVMMDLIQPGIMSQIVDEGVLGMNNGGIGNMDVILKSGLLMVVLVIFGGFCGSMNNVFVHMSAQNIGNEMRKDCFKQMMHFSFSQQDHYGTGSLVTRVTNDITQVENYVAQFVRGMIRTGLLMVGSIYFMFRLNRQFGIVILCAFPLVCGCMFICLARSNPLFSRLQKQLDVINGILQEDVSGIRMIKACVRETYEKLRFGKANDAQIHTQLTVLVIFALMNPIMNALMYVVIALILWLGSYQVSQGLASPGTIMAAITYATQLLNAILMLVMLFQNITKGQASWKRVKEILKTQPAIQDGSFQQVEKGIGKVEFRDVSFTYPGSDQAVLNHVNLTIEPGETVAIMGATGCGKTTLIQLIARFYDVRSGQVLVDDTDVRDYNLQDLRSKLSIALQKSELFSTTIKENIRWGQQQATNQEVLEVSRIAQAADFILSTPSGMDTVVAERGASLSGGQKQRIAVARAILKPAEIYLFDDATSALDLKTEANLYTALQKAKPHATKIMICQRIASVRLADRIIVLNQGTVEACGRHEDLLASCQTYQDIYDSQMGKEGDLNE